MDSLYLLIPIALVFVAVGIKLLLWAIDSGQYDDLDGAAHRILLEDEPPDADPAKQAKMSARRSQDSSVSTKPR